MEQTWKIVIHENKFSYIACKIAGIVSQPNFITADKKSLFNTVSTMAADVLAMFCGSVQCDHVSSHSVYSEHQHALYTRYY